MTDDLIKLNKEGILSMQSWLLKHMTHFTLELDLHISTNTVKESLISVLSLGTELN